MEVTFPGDGRNQLLYESDNLSVIISEIVTPNRDGITDELRIVIENNSENADLVESAFVTISNNCEELYASNKVEEPWEPRGFESGIYYGKLELFLASNVELNLAFSFEIHTF